MIKTPYLAVDGIIKLYDENENFQGIVLIERLNRPLGVAIIGDLWILEKLLKMQL